jgi:hypothetical protein
MYQRVWRSEVGRPLPPGHGALSTIRSSRRRRARLPIVPVLLALAGVVAVGAMTAAPGASVFLGLS